MSEEFEKRDVFWFYVFKRSLRLPCGEWVVEGKDWSWQDSYRTTTIVQEKTSRLNWGFSGRDEKRGFGMCYSIELTWWGWYGEWGREKSLIILIFLNWVAGLILCYLLRWGKLSRKGGREKIKIKTPKVLSWPSLKCLPKLYKRFQMATGYVSL